MTWKYKSWLRMRISKFFFSSCSDHLYLHSFPTRRSSDLRFPPSSHDGRGDLAGARLLAVLPEEDRKSTRLNSSHSQTSYAVFCLKKKRLLKHRYRHHSVCL